ncbi:F-box/kelch-repeat protein [Ananas comosus]|uniref:F-box/kelch-repeat protein n=1 Tax=Ananas comosus TaxID=4615 RepID=A0A199W116_ANACO|nr:F-box/kelch-repeat protein [Ananas comosus]
MGSRAKAAEEEEEEEKFDSSRDPRALCLYGDVLEAVASRVPTLDLVSASRVSREWRRAVRAALRRRPRRSPWLLLRLHRPTSTSASARGTLLAYDPHSRTWLPPLPHVRGPPPPPHLPSPRLPALHAASLSAMAVARDPFGATWRAVEAPRVWRVDPVVAATAGGHVAVIGGACQLALGEGEDAGAVELRGPGGSDRWEPCDPIPAAFDGSKSATWLSAATSDSRVYITDKNRGWTSWFDLEAKKWGPTRQLRPDPAAASFAIGILSSGYNNNNNDRHRHRHRLVLATAGRREGRVEVRLWEADAETLDVVEGKCAAAEMPKEFARRMFQEITEEESDEDDRSWGSSSLSVGLCSSGDGGYVYNGSDLRKGMVRFYDYYYYYHHEDGRTASCKWEWIGVPMIMQKEKVVDRVVVVGCTAVGLDDLAMIFPY